MSEITVTLARILGVYFLACGLGFILQRRRTAATMATFRDMPGLTLLTGALALLSGLVLVSLHNDWSNAPAVIVSLVGWIAILKGASAVILGPSFLSVAKPFEANTALAAVSGVVVSLAGLYLLYAGFM